MSYCNQTIGIAIQTMSIVIQHIYLAFQTMTVAFQLFCLANYNFAFVIEIMVCAMLFGQLVITTTILVITTMLIVMQIRWLAIQTIKATIRPKDIDESLAFWKPRKVAKGDFFNMQSMVCNDLGLVVNAGFGWQAFTTDELINYDNGFTWYTTFFHFIVSLLIIAEIITLANEYL